MDLCSNLKEVEFERFCPKCKHWETEDCVEPCDACLCMAMREGTFVPDKYEEKK